MPSFPIQWGRSDRPGKGVALEEAADRPALEMLHAQMLVQFNFFSGSCQPVTQLDVLDRWIAISNGVEPSGLNESLPAHRSPAGPESNRSLAGLEVHVAMHQVLVLGEKIVPRWLVVVGAEHRCELRIVGEVLLDKA